MSLVHVGLAARNEDAAERFYGGCLGLEVTRRSELPAEVAAPLFGVEQACPIVYYGGPGVLFELFITGFAEKTDPKITHTCLEVSDLAGVVARCRGEGFGVREVPKGEKTVTFVEDGDGNLFELLQAAPA